MSTNRTEEHKAQDAAKRIKYEKQILQKLDELHAVKERLYVLRHDYSRPDTDIAVDVKNLCTEYNRIDEDIVYLRKKELAAFEKSLDLKSLGVELLLSKGFKRTLDKSASQLSQTSSSSSSDKRPVHVADSNPTTTAATTNTTSTSTSTVVHNNNNDPHNIEVQSVEEHETMNYIPENEKLMRTKSTQSMQNLSAQQKWQSLFKMFKEWNHQTTVAQASQLVGGRGLANDSVQEEIIKLRSALYSMRQRKNMSASDKVLMEQLTVKLKGLTKIAAEIEQIK